MRASVSDPREAEAVFSTDAVEVQVARLDVPPARLARAGRLAEPAGRRFAGAVCVESP